MYDQATHVHLFEEPTSGVPVALSDAVPTAPISRTLLGCDDTVVSLDPSGAALTLEGPDCGADVWVVALSYDHDIQSRLLAAGCDASDRARGTARALGYGANTSAAASPMSW